MEFLIIGLNVSNRIPWEDKIYKNEEDFLDITLLTEKNIHFYR